MAPLRLLLLGGSFFVGREFVERALERGYAVTLFNRGRTNPGVFPEVEHLICDRDGGLDALRGREWDVVVDTSGFVPRVVRAGCELLRGSVGRYVFVSTTGVYAETGRPGCTEDRPLHRLKTPTEDHIRFYGPLKVACEAVVEACFGDASLCLRPGPVVGPHDTTDRFGYWPRRIAEGGDVLVPSPPGRLVQHIDVRDFARFGLDLAERHATGAFNVVTHPYSFADFLEACASVAGNDVDVVWADPDWLLEQGVRAHVELPVWLPGAINAGRLSCDAAKARAHGLVTRRLEATIADVLTWDATRPRPLHRGKLGERYEVDPILPERERELVARWRGIAQVTANGGAR